ncbi:MAG: hypothetical protein H0W54_04900 [Rubrobacter sp.]|nr:hypothetical protein [Rubrobacter sp.]
MPTLRGRALAAVKAELWSRSSTPSGRRSWRSSNAERKALAELLAESRRGLRAMMRPETPD